MIIIPTFNERKNILLLVERIRKQLPNIPILFVDDNSPDGTAQEIEKLKQTDPNIDLIERSGKNGFASAYLDAFQSISARSDLDIIVTMDADLSHEPEKLPAMLEIARSGEIAVGSRYVSGGSVSNWSIKRRILSRFGNWYVRFATKLPVRDATSGFMAIPFSSLRKLKLNQIQSRGYAFLVEIKLALTTDGNKLREVPIVFEERKQGESKISLKIIKEGLLYPAKIFLRRQLKHNYPAWILFFGSLFVYIFTAPRSIFLGDSAEFVTAVATLGIPHPPGYPTYVVLAKLFSFLPLGNLEFRIAIFSAILACVNLTLVYFIILKVCKNGSEAQVAALSSGLILAFSQIFWSQAIMAKIYMLSLFFLLLIITLYLKYEESGHKKYIYWSAYLFGLGFGAHQMIWLFLPLFFAYFYFSAHRPSWKTILICIGFLALGSSIYLYLPIRSAMHPAFDWGQTSQSLHNFTSHVLRTQYNDYGEHFSIAAKIEFTLSFFDNVKNQFGYLLLLAFPGLWFLWKNTRRMFWLTMGIFWINSLGIILIRSSAFGFDNEEFSSYYYLPAYSMVAFWIGFGIFLLLDKISNWANKSAIVWLTLCVLVLPGWVFRPNYSINNLHQFHFIQDYSEQILESLPKDSVLLISYEGIVTDTANFSLLYQQKGKGLRPDVKILSIDEIFPSPSKIETNKKLTTKEIRKSLVEATLARSEYQNRPIYSTFIADDLSPGWFSYSNGLVFEFFPSKSQKVIPIVNLQISSNDEAILKSGYFGRDLLAQFYYAKAAALVQNGQFEDSQKLFIQAINFDNETGQEDSAAYLIHRNNILY